MSESVTSVPIIERTPGYQALRRTKRRRALPGTRPLREPDRPCRICGGAAAKLKGHVALCDLHFKAVNDLLNHGETAAITTLREIAKAERGERGSLRERLKARNAQLWPDRPITRFIPVAGD